jgi:hypothetical protein
MTWAKNSPKQEIQSLPSTLRMSSLIMPHAASMLCRIPFYAAQERGVPSAEALSGAA